MSTPRNRPDPFDPDDPAPFPPSPPLGGDLTARCLRGLAHLVSGLPPYLDACDIGPDGHAEVSMFLGWSLEELAKDLERASAQERRERREDTARLTERARRRPVPRPRSRPTPRPAELADQDRR